MSGAQAEDRMPEGWPELVAAALDGTVDDAGRARLGELVASDPRCAREFASAALLHDALTREYTVVAGARRSARRLAVLTALRRFAVAAVLAVAVGGMMWFAFEPRAAVAADVELARIAQAARTVRRDYRIVADDHDPAPGDRRTGERRAADDRRPADRRGARQKPSIDGAVLRLGARGAYVLERMDASGEAIVSGSDGTVAWSVPARGAVRVSRDPARFRGGLPGEQHGLPFVDPADGVDELRRSYVVTVGPDRVDPSGVRIRTIRATRRADVARGPRDVVIEYDVDSALVRRMHFDRLPQAGGGPRAVTIELTGESPLADAYFSPDAHHAPGRKVVVED